MRRNQIQVFGVANLLIINFSSSSIIQNGSYSAAMLLSNHCQTNYPSTSSLPHSHPTLFHSFAANNWFSGHWLSNFLPRVKSVHHVYQNEATLEERFRQALELSCWSM